MYLLDTGGRFPGSEDVKLKSEAIANVINPALAKYLPSSSGVTRMVEPGRYYVASAVTPAVTIFAKNLTLKEQTGSDDEEWLSEKTCYMKDGAQGPFNCILCDHVHTTPLLQKRPKPDEKYYASSTWGPGAMASIALYGAAPCPRCTWGTGCPLETWVLTPLLCFCFQWIPEANHLLRDVRAGISESSTMTFCPQRRSRTSALCRGPAPGSVGGSATQQPALRLVVNVQMPFM